MQEVSFSPGDPLFYMHHGFIDRNYWVWQNADTAERYTQLGGYTTQTEPSTGWVETTLEYSLTSLGIMPAVPISEVMNTQGGYLCYKYDY